MLQTSTNDTLLLTTNLWSFVSRDFTSDFTSKNSGKRILLIRHVHGYYKHLLHHISTIEHRGVAKLLLLLLLLLSLLLLLLLLLLSPIDTFFLLSHLRLCAFINNIFLSYTNTYSLKYIYIFFLFSLCTVYIYIHGICMYIHIYTHLYIHTLCIYVC